MWCITNHEVWCAVHRNAFMRIKKTSVSPKPLRIGPKLRGTFLITKTWEIISYSNVHSLWIILYNTLGMCKWVSESHHSCCGYHWCHTWIAIIISDITQGLPWLPGMSNWCCHVYGSLKETLFCEVHTKTEERVFITGTVYVLRFKKQLLSIKYTIP